MSFSGIRANSNQIGFVRKGINEVCWKIKGTKRIGKAVDNDGMAGEQLWKGVVHRNAISVGGCENVVASSNEQENKIRIGRSKKIEIEVEQKMIEFSIQKIKEIKLKQ